MMYYGSLIKVQKISLQAESEEFDNQALNNLASFSSS